MSVNKKVKIYSHCSYRANSIHDNLGDIWKNTKLQFHELVRIEASNKYDPVAQVVLSVPGLVNPWPESNHFPPLSLAFFPAELESSRRILLNSDLGSQYQTIKAISWLHLRWNLFFLSSFCHADMINLQETKYSK